MQGSLDFVNSIYIAIVQCINNFSFSISKFDLRELFLPLRTEVCKRLKLASMQQNDVLESVLESLKGNQIAAPKLSGRVIPKVHGDVEVLACLTKAFPANMESFESVCAGRDWVKLDAVVVQVGPAGFASVPYNANSKGAKGAKTEPLYCNSANGTVFYSFLKGKTNKDRGDRVSEVEEQNVTAVLPEGVALSWFVNKEKFEDRNSKMVEFENAENSTGMLKAGKMVLLQLASSNSEQALKGSLLKLKKIFSLQEDTLYHGFFGECFPNSTVVYDEIFQKAKETASIANILQTGMSKYFMVEARRRAYVVRDPNSNDNGCIVCDAADDCMEIAISIDQIFQTFGCSDVDRALKLSNIAISCGGVRVLVRKGINYNTGDEVIECLQIIADIDKILKFDSVLSNVPSVLNTESQQFMTSNWLFSNDVKEKMLFWCNKSDIHLNDRGNKLIGFALQYEKKELAQPWNEQTSSDKRFCDGVKGAFYSVRIVLIPEEIAVSSDAFKKYYEEREYMQNVLLKFQIKEDCFGAGNCMKKRKRYDLTCSTDQRDFES